ncbi:MAG TPA: CHAP domain-containing protein [Candidatus Saccharimonadales bacterium]|nr:CHAP domain-containing protein [Candidatus Saccharimonadales bacterium]
MYQQASLFFYKYRLILASVVTLAFLVLLSALTTAIGSGTVLDARTQQPTSQTDVNLSDSPNTVTAGIYRFGSETEQLMVSFGSGLYGGCRAITNLTAQTGRSIGHGSAVVVGSAGKSIVWTGRKLGSGTMFVLHNVSAGVMAVARTAGEGSLFIVRLPGRIVGSITSGHVVNTIIKPADDRSVPVISSETSTLALARYNAAQQQEIAKLQAAQAVANRDLGGLLVAGDPHHGGYPAVWDNAVQDSQLDSWGMYNRECVSYTAWKVYQTYGNMPNWGGVGNANQWVRDARRAGIATGSTPQVHAVAISMAGYYGHAMWVEKVSGNMIYVSQYNYDLRGHYSEMWVKSSYFTYIYFK